MTTPKRRMRWSAALLLGLALWGAALVQSCAPRGEGERRTSPSESPVTPQGTSLGDSLGAIAREANARETQGSPDGTVLHDAGTPPPPTRKPSATPGARSPFDPRTGFRSRARLAEHFEKHGAEFGDITIDQYLRRAQALRDASPGGDILEIVRDDGVVSRFDRGSGAFLAFDADGTIRTFFRPNDGEAYFRRQARRRAGR